MKNLLIKEMKLTASPLTYFFLLFSFMTFFPGYPILIGAFFVCLGVFYSFQWGRSYNDTVYTALLPVPKSDVVKAKYLFTLALQGISFILMTAFTIIRMTSMSTAEPYVKNELMNANLYYLGYTLLIFLSFNAVFLAGFFKTAYNVGKPYIFFCIATFAIIGVGEALHNVKGLEFFNTTGFERMSLQVLFLICCAVIFAVGTYLSYNISKKRFEIIDL